jgi:hypothetical protein
MLQMQPPRAPSGRRVAGDIVSPFLIGAGLVKVYWQGRPFVKVVWTLDVAWHERAGAMRIVQGLSRAREHVL